ncbi:hypothetical protein OG336_00735 [[Kitasatospora] papulosa]|uniref:hypothetical protein n=1 Tax=[Kitasatospora] papulosa TaxID=1464011 RepID=UPI002E11C719|nr:hypothetical protein OG336_00735 [[Kitasatospora] papulosa]
MDLVHLSDALLSHLTDLVPYLQFVAAAGGAVAAVRRAARAGRRRLNARRAPDTETSRPTVTD